MGMPWIPWVGVCDGRLTGRYGSTMDPVWVRYGFAMGRHTCPICVCYGSVMSRM